MNELQQNELISRLMTLVPSYQKVPKVRNVGRNKINLVTSNNLLACKIKDCNFIFITKF